MADTSEYERALIEKTAANGAAVVHAVAVDRMISLKAFDESGRHVDPPDVSDEVDEMRTAMREEAAGRPLVVEIRRSDDGYRLRHSFELLSVSPTQVVLDPGYRYPGHPAPGMPRPDGIEVVDRPTDPAVLAEVRGLVGEFVALYTSIKGRAPDLGEGNTEAEILAAETAMGLRLPEEVRALYRTVDSDPNEHGLLGAQSLLSLDTVVEWNREGDGGTTVGFEGLFDPSPVVFETHPTGHVRRLSRSDWWVTIATDVACNYCTIDLDPGPDGRRGQLFEHGRDFHGPVGYVAESVTAVIRQVVAALRSGAYENEDPESSYLDLDEAIGRSVEPDYRRSERVNDRDLASLVAGLDEPLDMQQLYLNDAAHLDLADLAPLANLRALNINRARTVAAALPHHVPVESLRMDARETDLAGLAGHPTLWHLEPKGPAGPVSVASLAAIPKLAALNLSDVDVPDLESIGELPSLRVLTLAPAQWRRLRDAGAPPPRLAAASMSGPTHLEETLDWVHWLRRGTAT